MKDQLAPAKGVMLAFAICAVFWIVLLASCSQQETGGVTPTKPPKPYQAAHGDK